MQLNNSIAAVVTGGASGLGAATARALSQTGVRVAIFDLDEPNGTKVAGEIGGHFAKCDVTDEVSVDSALAGARALHGQERILVNCAGIAPGKRTARRVRETGGIEAHDIASFRRCIEINLIGTFAMITKCAAGMMSLDAMQPDGERGVVISTASIAAEDGQIGQVAYSASKGGVQSMTLPIARDLSRDGIRVATILPGLFRTAMFDGLPEATTQALATQVPFPSRLGHPAEYGQLAVHICGNPMLNGVCIRLDGAIRLPPK